MNKTNYKDLRDTIADILIDTIARNIVTSDTKGKCVVLPTVKIMEHVEKALNDAYNIGRSEGYEAGYLECEQEHSEAEDEY